MTIIISSSFVQLAELKKTRKKNKKKERKKERKKEKQEEKSNLQTLD